MEHKTIHWGPYHLKLSCKSYKLGDLNTHVKRKLVDCKECRAVMSGSKVEYVKSQPQTRPHTCHWPMCGKQVPPAMWGCKEHWFKLPNDLRNKVWRTYKPGQEVTMTPSPAYMSVMKEVDKWIQEYRSKNFNGLKPSKLIMDDPI